MGLFGEKLAHRDVAIGMMLALSLGLGLLFLHFYTAAATQATALLFGNVLGVDWSALLRSPCSRVVSFAALAMIVRPLVFASLRGELAEARGVPVRFVSAAFLAIVALAVAECAQIVGVLLVFTLMVGPAAAAMNLSARLRLAVALSAALALAEAWGGLTLAFYTDWPTSFWITALSGLVFFGAAAARRSARLTSSTIALSGRFDRIAARSRDGKGGLEPPFLASIIAPVWGNQTGNPSRIPPARDSGMAASRGRS